MRRTLPLTELETRMKRFREKMDMAAGDWGVAIIFGKINQYYFTGTMHDGILVIPRDDEATLWVRRSFERALEESCFKAIKPMESFRDVQIYHDKDKVPKKVYLDTEIVTLALYQRLHKYLPFEEVKSVDAYIASVRSVKSDYELSLIKKSGEIHRKVLEEKIPQMLREGMSEAELATELFSALMEEGYQGITRFAMFDSEVMLGQIGFGESSIYPSYFNGPGGNYGLSPAVPIFGSRERKLKKGDLVYIDIGCGVDGYHTDKTMTYMFGGSLDKEAIAVHNRCVEIQHEIAEMLRPGEVPSNIYNTILGRLDNEFLKNFMGFKDRRVKFLGHGIGLTVDELPVLAKGFDDPIEEGMAFAVEPKKGIENIGMVGIENTFLVSKNGGISVTGVSTGLIPV